MLEGVLWRALQRFLTARIHKETMDAEFPVNLPQNLLRRFLVPHTTYHLHLQSESIVLILKKGGTLVKGNTLQKAVCQSSGTGWQERSGRFPTGSERTFSPIVM